MEDNRLTYPVVVVSAISSILLKVGRSSLPVDRISPNGINWSLSPPNHVSWSGAKIFCLNVKAPIILLYLFFR